MNSIRAHGPALFLSVCSRARKIPTVDTPEAFALGAFLLGRCDVQTVVSRSEEVDFGDSEWFPIFFAKTGFLILRILQLPVVDEMTRRIW